MEGPVHNPNLEPSVEPAEQSLAINEYVFYVDSASSFDNQQLLEQFSQKLGLTLERFEGEYLVDRQRLLSDDNYAASILISQWFDRYEGHDQLVTSSTQNALENAGVSAQVTTENIAPVQEAVTNPHFYRDDMGNPVLEITVDGSVISRQIAQSEQPVTNLSLEVGRLRLSMETRQRVTDYMAYEINNETYFSLYNLDTTFQGDQVSSVKVYFDETVTPQTETEELNLLLKLEQWTQADKDRLVTAGLINESLFHDFGDGTYNNLGLAQFLNEGERVERLENGEFRVRTHRTMSLAEALEQDLIITEAAFKTLDAYSVEEVDEPQMSITESYNPEFARESLQSLYQIALDNPDKVIFAATGNYNSYFYEAMAQLEQEGVFMPANLVTVGVYFGTNNNATDGATFFLHRDEGKYSASEATAYLSGIATYLINKGFRPDEVLEFMERELFADDTLISPTTGKELTVGVSIEGLSARLQRLQVMVPGAQSPKGTIYLS